MKRLDVRVHLILWLSVAGLGIAGTASAYPANTCVSTKQARAGGYCRKVLAAWASWDLTQNATARDAAIQRAVSTLDTTWANADARALRDGTNCTEATASVATTQGLIDAAISTIVSDVNTGLTFTNKSDATCGARILRAAAADCKGLLAADGIFVRTLASRAARDQRQSKARAAFLGKFQTASAGCPTTATAAGLQSALDGIDTGVVQGTIMSPNVDDTQFTTIAPTGTTSYQGQQLTPQCIKGTPYEFFVKRGSVNKLLMYYEGGGACWDALTCGIPVCDATVDQTDDPQGATTGFFNLSNPNNPFRDWNIVFVSYCSCDVHFGDAEKDYSPTLHIQHRGYQNARIAEKWAREHFLNPDVVFVTGSSAGAYGAWFHAPLLERVWPASQFHVLADAGNGVITQDFLQKFFPNWNFKAHLPSDIPGVRAAITSGAGIPVYTEAVAKFFPATTWSHYATAYDGGAGGQTGFYNIMLNNNNPVAALTWWTGSCQFNQVMTQQVQATSTALSATDNYRYYIGTGSRHTMWGSDKVYTDTTGGVPTLVDWINAMLASAPPSGNDPGWTNVQCTNCGLTLPGDPAPNPLQPPFTTDMSSNIVVVCP